MVVVRACWPSGLAMQKACTTLRAPMRSRLSPPCSTMRSTTCSQHVPQSLWRTADDGELSEGLSVGTSSTMTATGTYLEGRGGNALETGGGCLQEVLLAGMVALHNLPHTPQRLHWHNLKLVLEHNELLHTRLQDSHNTHNGIFTGDTTPHEMVNSLVQSMHAVCT